MHLPACRGSPPRHRGLRLTFSTEHAAHPALCVRTTRSACFGLGARLEVEGDVALAVGQAITCHVPSARRCRRVGLRGTAEQAPRSELAVLAGFDDRNLARRSRRSLGTSRSSGQSLAQGHAVAAGDHARERSAQRGSIALEMRDIDEQALADPDPSAHFAGCQVDLDAAAPLRHRAPSARRCARAPRPADRLDRARRSASR